MEERYSKIAAAVAKAAVEQAIPLVFAKKKKHAHSVRRKKADYRGLLLAMAMSSFSSGRSAIRIRRPWRSTLLDIIVAKYIIERLNGEN